MSQGHRPWPHSFETHFLSSALASGLWASVGVDLPPPDSWWAAGHGVPALRKLTHKALWMSFCGRQAAFSLPLCLGASEGTGGERGSSPSNPFSL